MGSSEPHFMLREFDNDPGWGASRSARTLSASNQREYPRSPEQPPNFGPLLVTTCVSGGWALFGHPTGKAG